MGPKFQNGDKVKISRSGEAGIVSGYATYLEDGDRYQVRYTAADGRASEGWFLASELHAYAPGDS